MMGFRGIAALFGIGGLGMTMLLCGQVSAEPEAGQSVGTCVPRSGLAGPTVRDDGLVYFRGQPDPRRSYIAAFRGAGCAKFNPMAIVILETNGDRVCAGDKVRTTMTATQVPGRVCVIDHLIPFAGDVDTPVP